jgi:hypothetical protein
MKSKTVGSIRWAASDPVTFSLSFFLYYVIGAF